MRRVHWDEENETWLTQNMVPTLPSRPTQQEGGSRLFVTDGITKQPLQRPTSAIGRSRPLVRQPDQALSKGDRESRYL